MAEYTKNAEAIAALNDEQYRVTQKNGTERPGTGEYLHNKEPGIYVDIVSASRFSSLSRSISALCCRSAA